MKDRAFATAAGVGRGLFGRQRMLTALSIELGPRTVSGVLLRFDHSNLQKRTALVMHVAQWDAQGRPEGGMTVIALAPTDP